MENFDIKKIKAIIGLGNPGFKYYKNRHNIGFRIVDEISNQFSGQWVPKDNFEVAEIRMDPQDFSQKPILLIKPLTYMNKAGAVIPYLLKKGIKPEEILVIHDELEKDFGKISLKFSGSARGHNGLRSIIGVIGKDFWRLRFGIGRPQEKSEVADFVLTNFFPQEEEILYNLIQQSIDLVFK